MNEEIYPILFYGIIGAGIGLAAGIAYTKRYTKKLKAIWDASIISLEKEHARRVHEVFTDAKTAALDDARKLMKSQEKEMRADSVKRSKVVTLGKIAEHFAPYLPGWHYNPQDARFLGSPIDFVVFDGMSEGVINGVVFVEIKTGNAHLSAREQDLQDIICLKKVRYEIIRIPSK